MISSGRLDAIFLIQLAGINLECLATCGNWYLGLAVTPSASHSVPLQMDSRYQDIPRGSIQRSFWSKYATLLTVMFSN